MKPHTSQGNAPDWLQKVTFTSKQLFANCFAFHRCCVVKIWSSVTARPRPGELRARPQSRKPEVSMPSSSTTATHTPKKSSSTQYPSPSCHTKISRSIKINISCQHISIVATESCKCPICTSPIHDLMSTIRRSRTCSLLNRSRSRSFLFFLQQYNLLLLDARIDRILEDMRHMLDYSQLVLTMGRPGPVRHNSPPSPWILSPNYPFPMGFQLLLCTKVLSGGRGIIISSLCNIFQHWLNSAMFSSVFTAATVTRSMPVFGVTFCSPLIRSHEPNATRRPQKCNDATSIQEEPLVTFYNNSNGVTILHK